MSIFVILLGFAAHCYCYIIEPGPLVVASKGAVWPKPLEQRKSDDYFVIRPHLFSFQAPEDIGCPNFLNEALSRYWTTIAITGTLGLRQNVQSKSDRKKFWMFDRSAQGYLQSLSINLDGECTKEDLRPQLGDDESYTLNVTSSETSLSAPTIWGILRGLETFSQLIYIDYDVLRINLTTIKDSPRFSHRGLLLDTSRHFIPTNIIFQMLDAMAYNKLNVFHWHIVDDPSFPYKSRTFPELSDQGAYHPISKVYEQSDVKRIVEYARLRGIRVLPEFDTPGHTRSWGISHPELLTPCYTDAQPNGELGPMDPTQETTYDFLTKLFTEIVDVFPDAYFHIGGDEVSFGCWQSNPNVTSFMKGQKIEQLDDLQTYFIHRVMNILDDLEMKYIVWEEVFASGEDLPNSTVVHVWKEFTDFMTLWRVTAAGKFALFSSCWYLDHLDTGGDWQPYYECEPLDFPGTDEAKTLVLGGEACMWSEVVNEYNAISRVWPRASAAAERLWSAEDVTDIDDAKARLEEHACRMNTRGIQAQPPNGPGVCL